MKSRGSSSKFSVLMWAMNSSRAYCRSLGTSSGMLRYALTARLVILDWGMTLEVPSDLQYALLEFIAHINTENFDELPRDFINLGFSPPDVSLERLQNSGITEGLSFAFRQLSAG